MTHFPEDFLKMVAKEHQLSEAERQTLKLYLEVKDVERVLDNINKNAEKEIKKPALYKRLKKIYKLFGIVGKTPGKIVELEQILQKKLKSYQRKGKSDWGIASEQSSFVGREDEIKRVKQWMEDGQTRTGIITGPGGIGKTGLAINVGKEIESNFDAVIWKTLLTPPDFSEFMSDLIKSFEKLLDIDESSEKKGEAKNFEKMLESLIKILQGDKCLLIIDNIDFISESSKDEQNAHESQNYMRLFEELSTITHQSFVLLTSRSQLQNLSILEKTGKQVSSLSLPPLNNEDARKMLTEIFSQNNNIQNTNEQFDTLKDWYQGNPLFLKIVATHILEVYGGNIDVFLERIDDEKRKRVFRDLISALDELLPQDEKSQEILSWLAIFREPISLSELEKYILLPSSQEELPSILQSLVRLGLIEFRNVKTLFYTLHPVFIDYFTGKITNEIFDSLTSLAIEPSQNKYVDVHTLKILNQHCLLNVNSKDRQEQIRYILTPLIAKLEEKESYSSFNLRDRLETVLNEIRKNKLLKTGYIAGNLLNLILHYDFDQQNKADEWDFSELTIQQVYLVEKEIPKINFSNSTFKDCIFYETFGSLMTSAVSPDGQWLATGDTNGNVHLWAIELTQLRLCHTFEGTSWVRSISFSPNDKLAIAREEKPIQIHDISNRNNLDKEPEILQDDQQIEINKVWSVCFNPEGDILASGCDNGIIVFWKLDVQEQPIPLNLDPNTNILSICFNPSGDLLVNGCDDGNVAIWDVEKIIPNAKKESEETSHQLKPIIKKAHQARINAVAFSPSSDKPFFVTASDDQELKLWNLEYEQEDQVSHTSGVNSVAISADGKAIVSCSDDGKIKLWHPDNEDNKKSITLPKKHNREITSVVFCPQSDNAQSQEEIIFSTSLDQTIRVWKITQEKCLHTEYGYTNGIEAVAFVSDHEIVSGSFDKKLRLWNLENGKSEKTAEGHEDGIRCLAVNNNRTKIATGSFDKTVRLWDVENFSSLPSFKGHKDWVLSVAFHPKNLILASGSHDCTIKLWHIETGECIQTLEGKDGHSDKVRSVAFSPDGKYLASTGHDGTIKLWSSPDDTSNKYESFSTEAHDNWIWAIAFSPDGKYLASASHDGTIKLWNFANVEQKKKIEAIDTFSPSSSDKSEFKFWSLSFSSDGKYLAAGTQNGEIFVLAVNRESLNDLELFSPKQHQLGIWTVTFDPTKYSGSSHQNKDSKKSSQNYVLVSSSQDGTIKNLSFPEPEDKAIKILQPPLPYQNITTLQGVKGLNEAQLETLKKLGAEQKKS